MTEFKIDGQNRFMSDEGHQVFLWCVIVSTPHKGMQTHYVLAHDSKSAGGMAECAMGIASYETPGDIYEQIRTHVTKIPFTIQGWGKHKF